MKKFIPDPFYEVVLTEMSEEASKAAESWLDKAVKAGPKYAVQDGFTGEQVGTMLDVCGGAYLKISDGRKSFCKYVKNRALATESRSQVSSLPVTYRHQCRQEMGLHEAAKTAAFQVLKKYGLQDGVQFYSYID